MACRSGCRTQNHANWGECARDAHIGLGSDVYASRQEGTGMTQKAWDAELAAFDRATAQGIQPDSTKNRDIRVAEHVSNQYGQAYDGNGVGAFVARMENK